MPRNPTPLGKEAAKKPARPGHGGKREGSGRPPSKATQRSKAAAERLAEGIDVIRNDGEPEELPPDATPLDVMVMAMRVAYRKGGAIAAQPYARDAAPYIHARIAQMELKSTDDKPFTLAFKWVGD